MTPSITVYSMPACPACVQVKSYLKSLGMEHDTVTLETAEDRADFYLKCGPSVRSMPQVFVNGQRVGGFAGLKAALKQLELPL